MPFVTQQFVCFSPREDAVQYLKNLTTRPAGLVTWLSYTRPS
jgi:hypothetical protein